MGFFAGLIRTKTKCGQQFFGRKINQLIIDDNNQ